VERVVTGFEWSGEPTSALDRCGKIVVMDDRGRAALFAAIRRAVMITGLKRTDAVMALLSVAYQLVAERWQSDPAVRCRERCDKTIEADRLRRGLATPSLRFPCGM
jgi:hypothetical protein